MTEGEAAPIRDASSVILLRRQAGSCSVLMGMRGAKAAFMPSKYVFPGGAVDAADAFAPLARPLDETDRRRLLHEPRDGIPPNPEALAAAALRELVEEAGLMIGAESKAKCDWPGYARTETAPDASALRYVFRAITPPKRPRRFDARFFAADAATISGDPDDFRLASDELSHLHWVPLPEARSLNLPFITEVVLSEIAELIAPLSPNDPLPSPDTVPFFDNRQTESRFAQIT